MHCMLTQFPDIFLVAKTLVKQAGSSFLWPFLLHWDGAIVRGCHLTLEMES